MPTPLQQTVFLLKFYIDAVVWLQQVAPDAYKLRFCTLNKYSLIKTTYKKPIESSKLETYRFLQKSK